MFVEIISSGGEAIEISLDAKSPLLSLNLHPSAHADILIKAPIGTLGGTRSFQKRGPRFFLYLMFDNSLQIKTFLSILFFFPITSGGHEPSIPPLVSLPDRFRPSTSFLLVAWHVWRVAGGRSHCSSTKQRNYRKKAETQKGRRQKRAAIESCQVKTFVWLHPLHNRFF